jgi:molybdopterin converting factor small subunit
MAKVTAKLLIAVDGKVVDRLEQLECGNVGHLLETLARKYGKGFCGEIYDGKSVKRPYILLHNGKVVDRQEPSKVLLSDGDTVHIFMPLSGG